MLLLLVCFLSASALKYTTVFDWSKFYLDLSSEESTQNRAATPVYQEPIDFVVFENRLFVCFPRKDIASTLAWLNASSASRTLSPFPSLALQEKNNCSALQEVRAIQVDGRNLWAIDMGSDACPAKLWIFDPDDGFLVLEYQFPDEIVRHDYNYRNLTDFVLESRLNDIFAYILDQKTNNHLIVFSLNKRQVSRRWNLSMPFSSVAISTLENRENLYLSHWDRQQLSALPLSTVRDENASNLDQGNAESTFVGIKLMGSSMMQVDSNEGFLYYNVLGELDIGVWDICVPFQQQVVMIPLNENGSLKRRTGSLRFALDEKNSLWVLIRSVVRSQFKLLKVEPEYKLTHEYRLYNVASASIEAGPEPSANQIIIYHSLYVAIAAGISLWLALWAKRLHSISANERVRSEMPQATDQDESELKIFSRVETRSVKTQTTPLEDHDYIDMRLLNKTDHASIYENSP